MIELDPFGGTVNYFRNVRDVTDKFAAPPALTWQVLAAWALEVLGLAGVKALTEEEEQLYRRLRTASFKLDEQTPFEVLAVVVVRGAMLLGCAPLGLKILDLESKGRFFVDNARAALPLVMAFEGLPESLPRMETLEEVAAFGLGMLSEMDLEEPTADNAPESIH